MRSMTGSGQATAENARYAMGATLRGVNHKMLDVQVRLDEAYRAMEPDLRELLAAQLQRGRVELRIDIRALGIIPAEVKINPGIVEAAQAAVRDLAARGWVTGELSAGDLLRLPEAFKVEVAARDWTHDDRELLRATTKAALAQLVAARTLEGGKLRAVLLGRLAELAERIARIDALRGPVLAEAKAALDRRLAELLEGAGAALDPARLAQEAAILADRSDVSEEIDRLHAHLEHFRELAESDAAVGKRLDFLTQEIFRELNTLGAKCRHPEVVRIALDAKVLCEQIREQVQNVE